MTDQKLQLKKWVIQNMIDIDAGNLSDEEMQELRDIVSERKEHLPVKPCDSAEEVEEKPKIQWCGRCCSSHEMPPCEFIALPRHKGGHIPSFTESEHLTAHRIAMSIGEKCVFCKKEGWL